MSYRPGTATSGGMDDASLWTVIIAAASAAVSTTTARFVSPPIIPIIIYNYPFNKQSPPPPPPAPTRTTEIMKYEKNFCRDCENVFYCKDNNYDLYQKLYEYECKMWK